MKSLNTKNTPWETGAGSLSSITEQQVAKMPSFHIKDEVREQLAEEEDILREEHLHLQEDLVSESSVEAAAFQIAFS